MIDQECIDELADMAGFGPRVADITARAMNGELDFNAALTERVALLANLPEPVIAQVLAERITYAAGAPRWSRPCARTAPMPRWCRGLHQLHPGRGPDLGL